MTASRKCRGCPGGIPGVPARCVEGSRRVLWDLLVTRCINMSTSDVQYSNIAGESTMLCTKVCSTLANKAFQKQVCRSSLLSGRTGGVACCPLVSHSEYAEGTDRLTDRRTPDCYITLSDIRGQRNTCQVLQTYRAKFCVSMNML